MGTLLAFICHEPCSASQEHYSSCWQTTGLGWGEAAFMSLLFEVRSCPAPIPAPACTPVSTERLHQAPQLRLGRHSPGWSTWKGHPSWHGPQQQPSPAQGLLTRAWCPLGRGFLAPSFPTKRAICLHPPRIPTLPHPAQVPWATPEKHTHFIFYFSYKRPSCHCLTKTKVLSLSLENIFPE